jgi:hypothetical protein
MYVGVCVCVCVYVGVCVCVFVCVCVYVYLCVCVCMYVCISWRESSVSCRYVCIVCIICIKPPLPMLPLCIKPPISLSPYLPIYVCMYVLNPPYVCIGGYLQALQGRHALRQGMTHDTYGPSGCCLNTNLPIYLLNPPIYLLNPPIYLLNPPIYYILSIHTVHLRALPMGLRDAAQQSCTFE